MTTAYLSFWMDDGPETLSLSDYADLTLEFAGETLPLSDATFASAINRHFEFSQTWLAANAPSLNSANFRTTLAVDEMVSVCLRTPTQVCPGGTTTSSDASLRTLALAESGGTISLNPGFATGTTTYLASVANGIDTVTLTATKNDSNATVVITDDDDTTTPGVAELDLNVGSNTLTVTVTVTAEDGTTEQEYTITVTRAGAQTTTPVWSTTMTVGEVSQGGRGYYLYESDGALTRNSFEIGSTDYQVLALVAGPSFAGVNSNGLVFWANNTIPSYADYTLEFAGETLPLADATRTISGSGTISEFSPEWLTANASTLSAANFETTLPEDAMVSACLRTATQVCPGGTTTTSSDASLSALALAESGGAAISLTPSFATGTTTYLASVANGIDTVTLTATKNDSNATVVITDDDVTSTPGVAELDLDVGSNTLTVTVTAQDGTQTP